MLMGVLSAVWSASGAVPAHLNLSFCHLSSGRGVPGALRHICIHDMLGPRAHRSRADVRPKARDIVSIFLKPTHPPPPGQGSSRASTPTAPRAGGLNNTPHASGGGTHSSNASAGINGFSLRQGGAAVVARPPLPPKPDTGTHAHTYARMHMRMRTMRIR